MVLLACACCFYLLLCYSTTSQHTNTCHQTYLYGICTRRHFVFCAVGILVDVNSHAAHFVVKTFSSFYSVVVRDWMGHLILFCCHIYLYVICHVVCCILLCLCGHFDCFGHDMTCIKNKTVLFRSLYLIISYGILTVCVAWRRVLCAYSPYIPTNIYFPSLLIGHKPLLYHLVGNVPIHVLILYYRLPCRHLLLLYLPTAFLAGIPAPCLQPCTHENMYFVGTGDIFCFYTLEQPPGTRLGEHALPAPIALFVVPIGGFSVVNVTFVVFCLCICVACLHLPSV